MEHGHNLRQCRGKGEQQSDLERWNRALRGCPSLAPSPRTGHVQAWGDSRPPKSKDLQFQSQIGVLGVTGWILRQDCETPQGGRNRNQSLSWGLGVVRKRCLWGDVPGIGGPGSPPALLPLPFVQKGLQAQTRVSVEQGARGRAWNLPRGNLGR